VSAYDSGGLTLLTRTSSGYTTAKEIPVTAAGTVYIKMESSYNYNTNTTTGTFGLVYSTANTRPIDTQGINATALTADTWKYGQITDNSSSMEWYTLSVTNGTTYRFWSTYGGVFSPGALVSGYYSDGSSAFTETNNAWATAKSFTSDKNGTVYIRVKSEGYSSSAGIYGIVYSSTSTTRPEINVDNAIEATSLTVNQWQNDELTSQNKIFWYSFTVSAQGTYYLWADGSYNGSGTMTGDISTSAYNKDGSTTYPITSGSAWSSPQQINVNSSNVGKVYIKVEPFSNNSNGTFRVAYNTTNTRPTP
jgi:hypothetical protein